MTEVSGPFVLVPSCSLYSTVQSIETNLHLLLLALDEARKCQPTPTAFCVGCVIAARWPPESSKVSVVATGYSRELPGNTHAEANAISKAKALQPDQLRSLFPDVPPGNIDIETILSHSDIYTTLEPCSVRTSGLAPCADAIIKEKIPRCFIGVGEPNDFVQCEGARKLQDVGVKVIWLTNYQEECLKVARTGH